MYVSCSICRELFSSQCKVCVTQCGHLYHELCLDKWREGSGTCPHCRSCIKVIIREVELKFKDNVDEKENVTDSHHYQLIHDFKVITEQEKLLKEKHENLNSIRLQLKQLILDSKNEIKNSQFDIVVWETQLSMYDWVQDERKQLVKENEDMQNKVNLLEKLDRLVHGTELEMYEILTGLAISSSTVKELCTFVQAMKYKLKKNGDYHKKKLRKILQMSEDCNKQNEEEENEENPLNEKKQFADKAVQVDPITIQKCCKFKHRNPIMCTCMLFKVSPQQLNYFKLVLSFQFRRKLLKKAILNSNVLCAMGQRPRTGCRVEEQKALQNSDCYVDENSMEDAILDRIT